MGSIGGAGIRERVSLIPFFTVSILFQIISFLGLPAMIQ